MDNLIEEAPPNVDPLDQNQHQFPVKTSENVTLAEIDRSLEGECSTSAPWTLIPLPVLDPKPKLIILTCPLCNETCQTGRELSLHLDAHPKQTCKVCLLKFRNPDAFNRHSNSHKKPKSSDFIVHQFKCDYTSCEKTYKYQFNLQRHKYFHKNNTLLQRILTCENCEVRFSHEKEYNFHLENQSSNDGNCLFEPEIKCKICEKVFITVGGFRRHKWCKSFQNAVKIISDQRQKDQNGKSLMSTTKADTPLMLIKESTADFADNLKTPIVPPELGYVDTEKPEVVVVTKPRSTFGWKHSRCPHPYCDKWFSSKCKLRRHISHAHKITDKEASLTSIPMSTENTVLVVNGNEVEPENKYLLDMTVAHIKIMNEKVKMKDKKNKVFFCFPCNKTMSSIKGLKIHNFRFHQKVGNGIMKQKEKRKLKATEQVFSVEIPMEIKLEEEETKMTSKSTEDSKRKPEVIKDTLESSFVKKIRTEVTEDFQASSSKAVFSCEPCKKSFTYKYLLDGHLLSKAHEIMMDDVSERRRKILMLDSIVMSNFSSSCSKEDFPETVLIANNRKSKTVKSSSKNVFSKLMFSCKPCKKSFAHKNLLDDHLLSYAHKMMGKDADVIGYRCNVCNRIYFSRSFISRDIHDHLKCKRHLDNSRSNPVVKSEDVIVPIKRSEILNSISNPKTDVPSETSSSTDDEDPVIVNHVKLKSIFPEPEMVELISSDEEEGEVKPETIEMSQSASELETVKVKTETIEVPELVNSCHLASIYSGVIKVEPNCSSGVENEVSEITPKAIEVKTESVEPPEIGEPICFLEFEASEIKSETAEEVQMKIKAEPEISGEIVERNARGEFEVPTIVNCFPVIDSEVDIKPETVVEVKMEVEPDAPNLNEKPNFPCTKCSKKFQQNWELESHLAIHLRLERMENLNKSSDCIPSKSSVHTSTKTKVLKGKNKLYFCPICVLTFSKSYHFKVHYHRVHADIQIPKIIGRPKKPKANKVQVKDTETKQVKGNNKQFESITVKEEHAGSISKRDTSKSDKLKKIEANKNQVTKQVKVNRSNLESIIPEVVESGDIAVNILKRSRGRPKTIKVNDTTLPEVNTNKKQLISSCPELENGNTGNIPKRGKGRPKKIKVDNTKLPEVENGNAGKIWNKNGDETESTKPKVLKDKRKRQLYFCDICLRIFHNSTYFNAHYAQFHPDVPIPSKIPKPKKPKTNKVQVKVVENTENNDETEITGKKRIINENTKEFNCIQCAMIFNRKWKFIRHNRDFHGDQEINNQIDEEISEPEPDVKVMAEVHAESFEFEDVEDLQCDSILGLEA